jgi:hypothetical protein
METTMTIGIVIAQGLDMAVAERLAPSHQGRRERDLASDGA